MKSLIIALLGSLSFFSFSKKQNSIADFDAPQTVYDFTVKDIIGNKVALSKYKGKVLLIVNVASKCSNTKQYEDLQALYEEYADSDFVILGFPSNNFMSQEPGTDEEIKEFCTSKYGVTFPMFSKISVKGNDMHPLYKYLTSKSENGKIEAPIQWNFQKFLIGKDGKVIGSFKPTDRVKDAEIKKAISKHVKGGE